MMILMAGTGIPYLGTQEFYNDFSDFDAEITVPKNFLVWATGDLQNAGAVMQWRLG